MGKPDVNMQLFLLLFFFLANIKPLVISLFSEILFNTSYIEASCFLLLFEKGAEKSDSLH